MEPTSFFKVIIPLLLLLSIAASTKAEIPDDADPIKWVCDKVNDTAGCTKVLQDEPRAAAAKDIRALALVILDLAEANATKCMESLKKMQDLPSTPAEQKPVLEYCIQKFNTSAMDFKMGKQEMMEDPESGSYDVMVAMDGVKDCNNWMSSNKVNIPEVSDLGENIVFHAFIGNAASEGL